MTLLEGIVSLALLSMCLFVVGGLLVDYGRVLRQTGGQEDTAVACLAADRVRCDVEQALRIVSVSPGLVLEGLDPGRCMPTPGPVWNPTAAGRRTRIDYRLDQARLVRRAVHPDGRQDEQALAERLSDFQVRGLATGWLEVTLTVARPHAHESLRVLARPLAEVTP